MITFLDFYKRLTENSNLRTDKVLTFPTKLLTGESTDEKVTLTLQVKVGQETTNYLIYRAYIAQRTNERQD